MKKFALFVFVALVSLSVVAQMPGAGGQQANIGHIYGKIIDSADKAIGEVSVLLLQNKYDAKTKTNKEVLLKGMTTKNNGEFSLDGLPMFGKLKLKISATGYIPYEQEISFQMKMPAAGGAKPNADPSEQMANMSKALNAIDKDLGNIKLKSDYKQLQGVVVTSSKPLMTLDIDKKTFNVDKNIVTAGGTAVDVMRNVPSVQVDIDGNVKLRNASPQLYIDGRPTTLSLDQIPADAIESVEVITNPSAKYDASGGNAGILNIVLKKNKKTGYNGNLMAGVDRRGGYNGGGNFNVRQNKINFSAAVMVNRMRNQTTGNTNRYNYTDSSDVNILQKNLNNTKGAFIFGKLGLDYFITNRTTLSLGGIKVHGQFKPGEVIDINTASIINATTSNDYSQRISNSTREFNANGLQLGMKHNFAKEGEEWTADLNFFSGKNKANAFYTTNYYDQSAITGTQLQKVISDGNNKFLTIQTDYVKPLTAVSKIETGLRAQINSIANNNETFIQPPGAGDYTKITAATSNYKNTNNVYAAYLSFSSSTKKGFGYKAGLRAESSDYDGTLTNTGQKFSNKYPISLFPSLFLSQKLKNNQELQISATRRINRPNFFQLIPYTDYTDSLNITRGNPNLVPEFTASGEFSYSKTFKNKNTFLASIYYKHTTNLITRYLGQEINPASGKPDYISTFVNANSSDAYGLELTSITAIKKWWDMTTNINFYNSKINTTNIAGSSPQASLWSMFGKWNNNFKLPKNYTIQLSLDYQSKTNLPINNNQGFGPPMSQAQSSSQGYIRPFYGVDVAFKKTFLKNNAASVTLSFNDIFRTRKSDQHSEGVGFVQDYYRLNNPQMVRLNFAYRFGKIDMSLFKRQNLKSQGEGMQNAQMQ